MCKERQRFFCHTRDFSDTVPHRTTFKGFDLDEIHTNTICNTKTWSDATNSTETEFYNFSQI